MMADALRTDYRRDKSDKEDEVMDLSDPMAFEILTKAAASHNG